MKLLVQGQPARCDKESRIRADTGARAAPRRRASFSFRFVSASRSKGIDAEWRFRLSVRPFCIHRVTLQNCCFIRFFLRRRSQHIGFRFGLFKMLSAGFRRQAKKPKGRRTKRLPPLIRANKTVVITSCFNYTQNACKVLFLDRESVEGR